MRVLVDWHVCESSSYNDTSNGVQVLLSPSCNIRRGKRVFGQRRDVRDYGSARGRPVRSAALFTFRPISSGILVLVGVRLSAFGYGLFNAYRERGGQAIVRLT